MQQQGRSLFKCTYDDLLHITLNCVHCTLLCVNNREAAWEGWEGVPLNLRQGVAQFGDVVQYPLSDVVKNDLQVYSIFDSQHYWEP
jgi:hypothetical protein